MRKLAAAVILAGLCCGRISGHEGHKHEEQPKKAEQQHEKGEHARHGHHAGGAAAVSMEGEVVDMVCYMAHEGKGKKHKKCAQMCTTGGAPMGLLVADNSVYLLLENHDDKKPYQSLKAKAGEMVKVTGQPVTRGGVQALLVTKAE